MPPFFWTQKQDIGPNSRTNHGLANDGARQRVLLFGGDPGGPPLGDTWNWDGALWTQVADTGPSARHGLAMAFDAARQCIVLFGGASGSVLFADTWTWDGTEWTQVADTGPSARAGHALAYDGGRARVVLFGGRSGANPLGDTWEWDGTEWTQVQDVGPSARHAHAMAFETGTPPRVILFGGAGANGAGLNDTWLWDGANWTQVADTGPDPRAASAMVAATAIVLFGGVNSIDPALPPTDRIIHGDSWRWDGNAWTKVQDIGPAPRWGHGMAFRSDADRIVLFGGSSVFGPAQDASLQAGAMRDTWEHTEPQGQTAAPTLQALSIVPSEVRLADLPAFVTLTVTLAGPAPAGGLQVQMTGSGSISGIHIEESRGVPAGFTQVESVFEIPPLSPTGSLTITATLGQVSKSANLEITV
jgi:Galactose oxidase, central domain